MPTTQIIGFTTGNTMEVEAATHAARGTLRPFDYSTLGIYSLSGASGTMAAGIAAAAPIWSFRWGAADKFALVKSVYFSAGNTATAFTAGIIQWNLRIARGFIVADTGGTSLVPSGNQNKRRTSMATTLLATNGDCRIATTGALSTVVGNRNLDGDPIASLACGVPAVAGSILMPPTPFLYQRPGEYPLILAQNEGLVLSMGGIGIAATGTWGFGVTINWTESATYP